METQDEKGRGSDVLQQVKSASPTLDQGRMRNRDKNNRLTNNFDQERKREKMDVKMRNVEDMSEGGKGGKEDPTDTHNSKEITQSNTNFVSTREGSYEIKKK